MTYARSISTILALLALSTFLVVIPAGAAEAKPIAHTGCGQGEGLVFNDHGAPNLCLVENTVGVAVSTNPFMGEGLLAVGFDMEQTRPLLIASSADHPSILFPDCWRGEGFLVNPNRDENPCY